MTLAQRLLFTLFALTLSTGVQAGVGGFVDEQPLMPDEAFQLSTKVLDANTIRAEWKIADKYYLYKNKFKFISDTDGIAPGTPRFPKGQVKEDEFFGKVEVYHDHVAVDLPLTRTGGAGSLKMKITAQGCAEMGICYPPQTKTVSFKLPAMAAAETATANDSPEKSSNFNPLNALKDLGNSLGLTDSSDNFLPPDQAFVFSAEAVNGNTLRAHWDIHDGVYLYQDKFKFELKDANGITLGTPVMPKGDKKVDESFGEMIVYHHGVDIDIPLTRTNLAATDIILVAKYQGCADAGFCYPPMTKEMPISLPAGAASASAAVADTGNIAEPPKSEQDRIADSLASGNSLLTIITFFGFGLLLAFTPCVFPMIPILSSIIVGQGENITTRRAFIMSLVYVLAMALTYTAAGIAAGAFGENLQAAFQNPWILGSFAGIFVALSFSMFGFYDLQMPSFIQSKLTHVSNSQQGGTLVGVAIMGLLSALIVGPCVAAPLAGALIYIGQTGDMVLGGLALFALSLGMGAPLLAIGASAGKLLPKAGTWMDTIKAVFGVLMLAVAVWMLERIVPVAVAMMLWGTLMIGSAIYMGALDPLGEHASGWRKLWKGLGVVLFIYGALQLVGAAAGGKDTIQPLHGLAMMSGGGVAGSGTVSAVHGNEMVFKRIKGLAELDREVAAASAAGKSVMVDFYADWCVSCKEMEKYTFSDPGVQQALANTVLLQADVTLQDKDDKALQKKFGIIGPPSILFFGTDGEERKAYRVVGFVEPGSFRDHVEKAIH